MGEKVQEYIISALGQATLPVSAFSSAMGPSQRSRGGREESKRLLPRNEGSASTVASGSSATFLMKKRGRGYKQGPWAVGQHDRKRTYFSKERGREQIYIIRFNVGNPGNEVPFQPWTADSKFQELFPNGICVGDVGIPTQLTYPRNLLSDSTSPTLRWNRTTERFMNSRIQLLPADKMEGLTTAPTRNYTDDELEWPMINVIENRLRLLVSPGNKACTARLLIIQFLEDQTVEEAKREAGSLRLLDFFEEPQANNNTEMRPINAMMSTTMEQRPTSAPKWRVLTDQVWTMSPGDTASRQIPVPLEISKPHSNVNIWWEDGLENKTAKCLGKGRIVWGLFYQYKETFADVVKDPTQAQANDELPSYYGHYKFKWKLQI